MSVEHGVSVKSAREFTDILHAIQEQIDSELLVSSPACTPGYHRNGLEELQDKAPLPYPCDILRKDNLK
jgi:hypothetical protein